jgi:thiamine biosynthesis lipoprotein
MLGTEVNISIVAPSISKASQVFESAFSEIERIEDLMSPVREGSEIVKINKNAAYNPVEVSDEVYMLLKQSYKISEETGGAFDITFGALGKLWNYKRKPFVLPEKKLLWRAMSLVDYKYLQFVDEDNAVFLSRKGVTVGLGAIAKGYAVKKAVEVIKENGIRSGLVEAGGDVQVFGSRFGKAWRAGLQHPRRSGEVLLSIDLISEDSATTSGDYERFAFYKGQRYHHLLDPKTGYPAKTFSSVTVICKNPVLADAYSTALFVMGRAKAVEFLKTKKDVYAIMISINGKMFASRKLKERIKLFDSENKINWF